MKQTFTQIIAIILIGGLLVASCKKDEKTPANSFKYNDKESVIGTSFAGSLGTISEGSYGYYVFFPENTMKVHYSNSSIDSLSGIGDLLEIAMVSSDSAGIKPGVYNYSSSQSSFDTFTFGYESGLLINYNSLNDNSLSILNINGGKITVAKNGNTYEFTLTFTTTVNTTITGYYKGEIPIYEMNKKKSSNRNPFSPPPFK